MAIVFIACHKNNDEVPQPDPNKPTPDKPIPDKPKPDNPKPNTPTKAYLYGITIDDSWDKTKVTVQQIDCECYQGDACKAYGSHCDV